MLNIIDKFQRGKRSHETIKKRRKKLHVAKVEMKYRAEPDPAEPELPTGSEACCRNNVATSYNYRKYRAIELPPELVSKFSMHPSEFSPYQ